MGGENKEKEDAPLLGATAAQKLMTNERCKVFAPLSGKVIALDDVPDPIFADRLTGDGVAVLFEGEDVLAPCDGEITLFFDDTKHAFAITMESGIQVLVHVGLDTVILDGSGFTALHHRGDHVKMGEPVLKIDQEFLLEKKVNLVSPVLIVNTEEAKEICPLTIGARVEAGKDVVMEFSL